MNPKGKGHEKHEERQPTPARRHPLLASTDLNIAATFRRENNIYLAIPDAAPMLRFDEVRRKVSPLFLSNPLAQRHSLHDVVLRCGRLIFTRHTPDTSRIPHRGAPLLPAPGLGPPGRPLCRGSLAPPCQVGKMAQCQPPARLKRV